MKMKNFKAFLVALLAGITAFSVIKFVMTQKENIELSRGLQSLKADVSSLQYEKGKLLHSIETEKEAQRVLSEENAELTKTLNLTQEQLRTFDTDLKAAQEELDRLNLAVRTLKTESEASRSQNDYLKAQLGQLSQENNELKIKLGSIAELKKVIRELKRKPRKSLSVQLQQSGVKKNENPRRRFPGNQGFLLKNGKSTYIPKVYIEVSPVAQ
ncbi:MAG: hypothetical protein C4540_02715 [Candidatus Omnitrophota bacterium]|nr:MAG: hypothetical protein C4540_02715 [Candidatus Omnitrophota bacterium]